MQQSQSAARKLLSRLNGKSNGMFVGMVNDAVMAYCVIFVVASITLQIKIALSRYFTLKCLNQLHNVILHD